VIGVYPTGRDPSHRLFSTVRLNYSEMISLKILSAIMKTYSTMATIGILCAAALHPALAQKKAIVTCTGILIEVDMNPGADFPMAVVYDDSDTIGSHTCVLDLGHAAHWPLRGACYTGEKCVLKGPYFKKIGNTYYMKEWEKAEAPEHPN
jgi:hypothetical protein